MDESGVRYAKRANPIYVEANINPFDFHADMLKRHELN